MTSLPDPATVSKRLARAVRLARQLHRHPTAANRQAAMEAILAHVRFAATSYKAAHRLTVRSPSRRLDPLELVIDRVARTEAGLPLTDLISARKRPGKRLHKGASKP